jgi:Phage late control gene D protein (GPD).
VIKAIYQSNRTGNAFEISSLMSNMSWNTVVSGSPGKVEISLLKDYEAKIDFEMGSVIAIKDVVNGVETEVFYGYLFKIDTNSKNSIRLTFYDQLRYLVSNATYVFKDTKLRQLLTQIASDFNLKMGHLENPNHIIRPLVMDNKKILDIILTACDDVLIASTQLYVFFDNYGKLELRRPQDMALNIAIQDSSVATSYNHTRGIDESYNYVKLVKDNKDTGEREVYIVKDSNNERYWGKLQYFDVVDEKMNAAQINEQATQLLSLHNREKYNLSIEGLGNIAFRGGRSFYMNLPIARAGWYVIDEAKHNFNGNNHTMSLTIRMV